VIYPGNTTDRSDLSGSNVNTSNTRYITLNSNQSTNNITRITTTNTKNVVYRSSMHQNNL
jgi:hypothetical protein